MKRSELKRKAGASLTDTQLDNLEPDSKEYRILDSNNLYFRVKPNGGKSWQYRFKRSTGKWAWLGLGSYPEVTGAAARRKALDVQQDLSNGIDPIEAKQTAKQKTEVAEAMSFRRAYEDWLKFKTENGLAEGTLSQVVRYFTGDILPLIGDKHLDDVSREDCALIQKRLEGRGAHNISKKVRSWLNQVYGRAIAQGKTQNDPASRLLHIAAKSPKTQHYPHLLEPELPDFLRSLKASKSRMTALTAAWLCIWTASRPGMVRHAEWAEIDLAGKVWRVPAEKMKTRVAHDIPLSKQAVNALTELHRVTGRSRWVFPGVGSKNPVISENTINKVFAGIGYKGRMVGHGSRHTASTLLNEHKDEHGFSSDWIEAQLAHAKAGVKGVYDQARYFKSRQKMMQWYADYLEMLEHKEMDERDHRLKSA